MSDRFGESYWNRLSGYRKFGGYAPALRETMRWYSAFLRFARRELGAPGRHLDVGCGHGALVHLLLARGFDSHGVDVSSYIIEETQRFAPELADRFAVADVLDRAPFPSPFDLVTCLEVLEHVDRPKAALERMADLLAPGGRLVATTPNPSNRFPYYDPASADPTHVSLRPPEAWAAALADAGLEPVRVTTYWAVPLVWRASQRLATWLPTGRTAGPGILLAARRR